MAEYRDTVTTPSPATSHTTIVTDSPRRSSGSVLLIIVVVLLLGIVGLWLMSGMNGAEISKDNAVAAAADKVGAAAGQVGDAAQDVAQDVTTNGN